MIQLLEASPRIPRMAPPHVLNIAMKPFEEVENDKGLVVGVRSI